ncbi:MAG: hypothetical protein FWB95_02765 [Treponema sp.]|nr:hypothetical protein [Treponema sp.]
MSETKKIIDSVLYFAKDTEDPKAGAVFEKTVEIDFPNFCAFVLTQWDSVTMESTVEDGVTIYLFYNGAKATDHVASYICGKKPHGCFGGSRVGSGNDWNESGVSYVKNAFVARANK